MKKNISTKVLNNKSTKVQKLKIKCTKLQKYNSTKVVVQEDKKYKRSKSTRGQRVQEMKEYKRSKS